MTTKPTGEVEIDGNSFEVLIRMHTDDAQKLMTHTEKVRELVAVALEQSGNLQEEIDFTLEVERIYKQA